jgi:hypothetical protein
MEEECVSIKVKLKYTNAAHGAQPKHLKRRKKKLKNEETGVSPGGN